MTRQRWRRTQFRKLRSFVRMSVCRNSAPIEARTTAGAKGSIWGPTRMNPAPPMASEVRIRLPRFPSERTASSTTQQSLAADGALLGRPPLGDDGADAGGVVRRGDLAEGLGRDVERRRARPA